MIILGFLYLSIILYPSLSPAAELNLDEAELLYAQARVLANSGKNEEALRLAQDALRQDPDSAPLWRLALESAKILGKKELLEGYEKYLQKAQKKEALVQKAKLQLEHAVSDMDQQRWKLATRRLEYITRHQEIRGSMGKDLLNEAHFRLGMSYLAQSDASRAVNLLIASGEQYRRQSSFVLGNFYYQRGYLNEACRYFADASDLHSRYGPRDRNLEEVSQAMLEDLEAFEAGVQGSVLYMQDSNPFGMPKYARLSDQTENSDQALYATVHGTLRAPVSRNNFFTYHMSLGGSQYYSLLQGSRQQLDSQVLDSELNATWSRYKRVRAVFKYFNSFVRTRRQLPGDVKFRWDSQTHGLSVDLSKELREFFTLTLTPSASYGHFYTPSDEDAYNRMGNTYGLSTQGTFSLNSRWFYPSLKGNAEAYHPRGGFYSYRSLSVLLMNSTQLSSKGAALELNAGYERRHYFRLSEDRRDQIWRGGLTLIYPLWGKISGLAQLSASRAHSTLSYYSQDRILSSAGMSFYF